MIKENTMKKQLYIYLCSAILFSCDGFLDEKPSKTIDTPDTLEALDALLDNSGSLNSYPVLPLMLGGEYFSDDAGIIALPPWEQNVHLWKSDPFQVDDQIFDWRNAYNQIQNANVIMESLDNIEAEQSSKDEIRGAALFYRAHAYYNLSVIFLEGPNLEGTGIKFEIPVRTTTSMVLKAEYTGHDQIKQLIRHDLEGAVRLLPDQVAYPFRPSKKAAKALKARVHLSWEEYDIAAKEAGELLSEGLELMDYKEIDPSKTYPFVEFNKEVIWQCRIGGYLFMYYPNAFQVNPGLLDLYQEDDLRRSLFFVDRPTGYVNYRGSYEGDITLFGGLASDEIYLIYAESLVRNGDLDQGAKVLNELLATRYNEGYTPISFENETSALKLILEERRKELVFRGLRWVDLRRLNKDERFETTLGRSFEGVMYELAPGSEKYVLPVPARELSFK